MSVEDHVRHKSILCIRHFPLLQHLRDDTLATLRTSHFITLFKMADDFDFDSDIELVLFVLVLNDFLNEAGFIV